MGLKMSKVLRSFLFTFLILFFMKSVAANDSSVDGSGANSGEEEDFVPTTKSEKALHKLKEFIGIRGKVANFQPLAKPPEYMMELYEKMSNPNIKYEDKNPYHAQIIRGYIEKKRNVENTTVKNVFYFDISGFEKGEFILEVELRLFRKDEPIDFLTLSHTQYYLIRVYQILPNRSLHDPDDHRLLNVQFLSIFDSEWQIFNVKEAVQAWINGAPNLGLLVTASSIRGDPMNIEYIRRSNDTNNNSKQPVLVLFNCDGEPEKSQRKEDISCKEAANAKDAANSEPNYDIIDCSNLENVQNRRRQKRHLKGSEISLKYSPRKYIKPFRHMTTRHMKNSHYYKFLAEIESCLHRRNKRDLEQDILNFQNHDAGFVREKKEEEKINNNHHLKINPEVSNVVSRKRKMQDIVKSLSAYERFIFLKMLETEKKGKKRQPPKLLVNKKKPPVHMRSKRSSESRSMCVKSDLNVDFDVIGLGSRIIAPKNYTAYQCRGPCNSIIAEKQQSTNHAFIQGILRDMDLKDDIDEISCVPTKLLSSAILYYDERKNVVLKIYDDMIVDECGCR